MKESGLRFNKGKLRYDLLHPVAQEGIVKVLTKGAEKYAPKNWEKGMSWMSVVASLKRHLAEFEKGIDYDEETGLLHIDHIQCNAHFLSAFYKIAQEFDDRTKSYMSDKKIGLDIDEVICDWVTGWREYYNINKVPTSWFFDREIIKRFNKMKEENTLEEFYSNLKPLLTPEDIPFEPHCYITSRPCSIETTINWLDKHGFPTRPVYCVGVGKSKVDVAKESGITHFVDDRYENFVELNNAGICTFLFDAPHNQRYQVGYKRIYSLIELA